MLCPLGLQGVRPGGGIASQATNVMTPKLIETPLVSVKRFLDDELLLTNESFSFFFFSLFLLKSLFGGT